MFNDKIFAVNKDGIESPLYDVVADPEGAVESIKEWIKSNPSGGTSRGKQKFIEGLIKTVVIPVEGQDSTKVNPTTQPGNER